MQHTPEREPQEITIDGKSYIPQWRAASILGLTEKGLAAWRTKKYGPAYHRVGVRVLYTLDDLVEFINSCRVTSKSHKAA